MSINEHYKIRIAARFYGDVQGVGFRYTARHAAGALGLTGWVRNEYDGSVSTEIQGDPETIEEWLNMIRSGRYIDITHYDWEEIEPVLDERGFRVDY